MGVAGPLLMGKAELYVRDYESGPASEEKCKALLSTSVGLQRCASAYGPAFEEARLHVGNSGAENLGPCTKALSLRCRVGDSSHSATLWLL